jgi:flagellar protein FlbD
MIEVTKLNNEKVIVNADLIEFIEQTPDTMITMTTGRKTMVKETVQEVIAMVMNYKRRCLQIPRKKR